MTTAIEQLRKWADEQQKKEAAEPTHACKHCGLKFNPRKVVNQPWMRDKRYRCPACFQLVIE